MLVAMFFGPTVLGAALTNAQASILGAAIFGARQETIRKDAAIQVNVGQHLAALSTGPGVVLDCCEVGVNNRFVFSRMIG